MNSGGFLEERVVCRASGGFSAVQAFDRGITTTMSVFFGP